MKTNKKLNEKKIPACMKSYFTRQVFTTDHQMALNQTILLSFLKSAVLRMGPETHTIYEYK